MMRSLIALLVTTALAAGQQPAGDSSDPITEERVLATVQWLAHDDRRGRATGSPELEQAAEWLQQRFEKAGLRGVRDGVWFHEFTLPAVRIDSDEVKLRLTLRRDDKATEFTFVAGRDVRQLRPTDGLQGEEACTVARADDPVLGRLLRARSARRPIIVEVAEDHPYWQQSKGVHTQFVRRRQAARPVLLVREGLLPKAEPGLEEWTANWAVAAAEARDVVQRNVVAMLPAAADSPHKDEYVVVSAHYDHVGVGVAKDGDDIYNGADDDATGTTAVVLLAESLAKEQLGRNVLFVCFAAEERGLEGSKAFCARPPVPLDAIVANLNIEMIGRPEEGKQGMAWFTGSPYSDFAEVCTAALEQGGVGVTAFRLADRLFAASDNASFALAGVVAHSISAGSLHRDYHQPGDEVDKLDIPHMTKIIKGLRPVVIALADREPRLQWTEAGQKELERMRRRRR